MRIPHVFAAILLAAGLAGGFFSVPAPASAQVVLPTCQADYLSMARLELYFGTERPDGSPVTDAEWNGFLDEEVTPRFPDGLTVLTGNGQWRNSKGVITKETSAVLVILYVPSDDSETKIEAVRSAYKKRFDQESVMRVDSANCVSF
ncbi:DUF3574 domain-containing protein [Pelagibius litoralis]|uniref:DUF3574 domain-containing protein n=1 Tax=Pelagibius litoralis TaxID=374515 RepID=A0A967C3C0_9PROT|nr:DUF3574 domain-containing protein [Pelagibius litoralis]NIA67674.1 DUF3574 domain-containing protein [Pelagibius litoralis]